MLMDLGVRVAGLPTPYLCCVVPLIYGPFCFGNCSCLLRVETYYLQECIPVGCIPPAHYRTGGSHDRDTPDKEPPDRDPLDRDPPDRDRPDRDHLDRDSP